MCVLSFMGNLVIINNPVMTSYMKSSQKGLSCLHLVENRSRQYLELKKNIKE